MFRFLILVSLLLSRSIGVAEDNVQYGGDLNVGTVNVTLSALSWIPGIGFGRQITTLERSESSCLLPI